MGPGTGLILRRYAVVTSVRLVWRQAMRWAVRTSRWTPEEKADGLTLAAMGLAITAFPLAALCSAWWLLTGGGPVRWLRLDRASAVDVVGGTALPRELHAAMRSAPERWRRLADEA